MPVPASAQAEQPGGLHRLPGQSGSLAHFLIRYAGVPSRKDSPSVFVLLARGFVIEAVDERYDTFVMRKDLSK